MTTIDLKDMIIVSVTPEDSDWLSQQPEPVQIKYAADREYTIDITEVDSRQLKFKINFANPIKISRQVPEKISISLNFADFEPTFTSDLTQPMLKLKV